MVYNETRALYRLLGRGTKGMSMAERNEGVALRSWLTTATSPTCMRIDNSRVGLAVQRDVDSLPDQTSCDQKPVSHSILHHLEFWRQCRRHNVINNRYKVGV